MNNLKRARLNCGYSLDCVVKETKMSRLTIKAGEKNISVLSWCNFIKLADLYKVSTTELMSDEPLTQETLLRCKIEPKFLEKENHGKEENKEEESETEGRSP